MSLRDIARGLSNLKKVVKLTPYSLAADDIVSDTFGLLVRAHAPAAEEVHCTVLLYCTVLDYCTILLAVSTLRSVLFLGESRA